jgi:hypothetical protein
MKETCMARIYGRIRLTEDDLKLVRRMLGHGLEVVTAGERSASEDDERAFYAGRRDWLMTQVSRFEGLKPGVTPFSEKDLGMVRGSVIAELRPQLRARWAERNSLDDADRQALAAEIDHVDELERKLEQPFLRDRSQDPEPEDDSEDDEQHDGPSSVR